MIGDRLLGLIAGLTIEAAAVHQGAGSCPGLSVVEVLIGTLNLNDPLHRQLIGAGKAEVTLVMRRHPHHGTGAISTST